MAKSAAKTSRKTAARQGSRTTAAAGGKTTLARIKGEAARMAHRIAGVKFDVAQQNGLNRRHWTMADGASPIASLTPEIRRLLRERSRYEAHNNSWAKGILSTLANDLVGTGPRLRLLGGDETANQSVEKAWQAWADATGLAAKLRTMRFARGSDGECFAVMSTNKGLRSPVKLDLRLYEADQIESPSLFGQETPAGVSGIEYDADGNPTYYSLLKSHPGESGSYATHAQYTRIRAAQVLHYFRSERPGQLRGVPDLVPALGLFAQMRRYTQATVGAAEYQAARSGYIYTTNTPNSEGVGGAPSEPGGTADGMAPFDTITFEHNEMTALPDGWQASFAPPSQPVTTYDAFQFACLREACRCMNIPVAVAIGDSSKSNYSSGRLDHQVYLKQVEIERAEMGVTILDRLWAEFWSELQLISDLWGTGEGQIPRSLRTKSAPTHKWLWDGREHVDPAKEAKAATERLQNGTSCLSDECARSGGRDWRELALQRAAERKFAIEQGLPDPYPQLTPAGVPAAAPSVDPATAGVEE